MADNSLAAERACITTPGPALNADAVQVGQSMFLDAWFTATGTGRDGAVRLPGAHIGLNVYFDAAQLANDSGPALFADGLRVDLSMFLRREVHSQGRRRRRCGPPSGRLHQWPTLL